MIAVSRQIPRPDSGIGRQTVILEQAVVARRAR
jgi:hypothetical protein